MSAQQQVQTSNVIKSLFAFEIAEAERVAGLSIATLEDPNYPKMGILGALAFVAQRRHNRELKYDEFMQTTTMEQIAEILGLEDEASGEG